MRCDSRCTRCNGHNGSVRRSSRRRSGILQIALLARAFAALWRWECRSKHRFAIVKAATPQLETTAKVCSVAAKLHNTRRASRLPPKARVAGGIDNFWEEHCPATWANIAAATLAMQDADEAVGYLLLACVAIPNERAIRCRLGFNADKAVSLTAIKMK